MCGLVGVAGLIGPDEKKFFKRLLELDTSRGPHSTGIATINDQLGWNLIKRTGTPWDLYDSKEYTPTMNKQTNVLMGHNRWATKGAVNATNAHPFAFDGLIGMHNGTLRGQFRLDDHKKFDVDSENLFYHMNKNGLDDTIKVLDGAFALVWYDLKNKSLNLLRNDERPLFFAYTEDMKTMAWASEPWMLRVASAEAKVKLGKIIDCGDMQHHRIDVPLEVKIGVNRSEVPPPITTKMEEFELPKYQRTTYRTTTGSTGKDKKTGGCLDKDKVKLKGVPTSPKSRALPPPLLPLSDYVGQEVDIEVVGEATYGNNKYLNTRLMDDPGVFMRIYLSPKDELWQEMIESTSVWMVRAKRASKQGDTGYLIGDLREIYELEDYDYDEEEEADKAWQYDTPPFDHSVIPSNMEDAANFPGYQEAMLTERKWLDATATGCAWCSDPVSVIDAHSLMWFSPNEFFCVCCTKDNEAREAIN